VPLVIDEDAYKQLIEAGIDHLLAQHIAHLFIRDSVSLFSEKVHQDDETETDHFEVELKSNDLQNLVSLRLLYFVEHSEHKLADDAVQAASSVLAHRLAG
jgi:hypothetical protein